MVVELTPADAFSTFFRQRPRRFAPDYRPGIFIVAGSAVRLRRCAKFINLWQTQFLSAPSGVTKVKAK
jgi:hypothetical protein